MLHTDATILGFLGLVLMFVFTTSHSSHPGWKKFYSIVPALLLVYFIPGLFSSLGVIDTEGSKLYYVASRYLLPPCLILLILSVDLKGIISLGPKAIIMALAGTLGVIIGGPLAIMLAGGLFPEYADPASSDALWRGMSTVAGTWIGGGANQTAMKEIFEVGDNIFSIMVVVDIIIANIWMGFLLWMVPRADKWDAKFKADRSAIDRLQQQLKDYHEGREKIPTLTNYMQVIGLAFLVAGLAHFLADLIGPFFQENFPGSARFSLTSSFFWLIVLSTTFGLCLSFSRFREYESYGASKIGSIFLYFLVATIGMKMNIVEFIKNPSLFLLGGIWILTHGAMLLVAAYVTKSPFFYFAVGSQANIGGAASAPVVAAAFHPMLAPVGVLLAVFGYAVGTYGAWLTGVLMRMAAS